MNEKVILPVTTHNLRDPSVMDMSERLTGLCAVAIGLNSKSTCLLDICRSNIKIVFRHQQNSL